MKIFSYLVILLLASHQAGAQKIKEPGNPAHTVNAVKINLGSIAVKNMALQYERAISKKTSLALGLRWQPYGSLPFKGAIRDAVNDPDILVNESRMGNFALTPEFRYYFGQAALKGLYIAPYARYANFKMQSAVNYTSVLTEKTAYFNGSIRSISGGILLGSLFRLGGDFMLDCWILGAHFGSSGGELLLQASLSPQEQEDLRQSIDEVDIPLFNIEHDINSSGGTIRSKGAWAGFRGLAVNLVYRF